MAHHTTNETNLRGRRSGVTAAGLPGLLLLPLSACGQQDAAAPAASSTPERAAASVSSSSSAPTTASSSPATDAPAAGQVLAVAEAYLQARAEGDADAAWAALSSSSQEA